MPLSETMQAVIPADLARPDELAAAIEEQQAELAAEDAVMPSPSVMTEFRRISSVNQGPSHFFL